MHIVFVNTLYPPHGAAGAETTLRLLVASMMGRGHRCDVVTLGPGEQEYSGEIDGVPVHYLPLANVYWPHNAPRPKALRPVFQAIEAYNPVMRRRLQAKLSRLAPDVVNAHNLQGFSASAWVAAARARVPLVQTIHDYYTACPRSSMWRPGQGNCATLCTECRIVGAPRRALSRLPAAVTCVSHRVFDRLTDAGAYPGARTGQQPVRIIRGNNATDTLPDLQHQPSQTLRLGFIGRLDPSKGVERLLDAVARQSPATVSLDIAGSGDPAYVAALKARAPPDAAIRFLGHVAPTSFFPAIDLLVIPSVWEDPFPRVFHEALAYGVPSLVSPLGGVPEAVQDGRTGFLIGSAGEHPLADRLSGLITDGWDRAAVSAACRAEAARYAPSRIAAEYEAVIAAVASGLPVPVTAGEPWRGAPPPQ